MEKKILLKTIAMVICFVLSSFDMAIGEAIDPRNISQKTGASGLAIPRFVSLAADKAFLRTGPGSHYPIEWVYRRPGLPLMVIDEYDNWRQVTDHDQVTGWFHSLLLSGKRTALILEGPSNLYEDANPSSRVTLIAEAGVTGLLQSCKADWCQLEIEGRKGWIERARLYGTFKKEDKIR